MKAMILAAGRGERMRPLTDSKPKALLSIGGKALIEYHINALSTAGIKDVVINLAWLGSQIVEFLGDGERYGVNIGYSDEGERALETGGGIFRALPLLGEEPFWVVNGDVYTDYSFGVAELPANRLAHLILVANPDHNLSGDFALDAGQVRNDGHTRFTYSGIGLYSPQLFTGQNDGAFPLAPLLRAAANKNYVSGEVHSGLWSDVGTPQRLQEVNALCSN